jgi:hypothetical protein
LDSLMEVILENRLALGYLLAEQDELCVIINKTFECYVKKSGLIETRDTKRFIHRLPSWICKKKKKKKGPGTK